ncbi:MAG: hypothetical protein U0802_22530 [Candidatus Binatia bacterium]
MPTLSLRENIFLPAPADAACGAAPDGAWRRNGWRASAFAPPARMPPSARSPAATSRRRCWPALRRAPRLLLLDEPTAGVDVAAKADIHAQVHALAAAGTAVGAWPRASCQSYSLCDRIVALYSGRVTGEFDARTCGEAALAAAITGQDPAPLTWRPAPGTR